MRRPRIILDTGETALKIVLHVDEARKLSEALSIAAARLEKSAENIWITVKDRPEHPSPLEEEDQADG